MMMKQTFALVLVLVAACLVYRLDAIAAPIIKDDISAPQELREQPFLFEVLRHLYRWYMDETDAEKIVKQGEVHFWIRGLQTQLDPGDKSRLGEIVLPQIGVSVTVKKADYMIEELNTVVKNDTFKIINVSRGSVPASTDGFETVKVDYKEVLEYVFRTKDQARFPDDEMLMRMRLAAREELTEYLVARGKDLPTNSEAVHFSPISPVANEIWVFWEGGRMLLRFASDIDLENEAVWEHDELAVKLYNVDEQTVVSLHEVAGSNAYMTRDQVGRALFNCIVNGRRLVLNPEDVTGADVTHKR